MSSEAILSGQVALLPTVFHPLVQARDLYHTHLEHFPSKYKTQEGYDDLKVDYSSRWSLNYFWYPVFRHGWRRGVLLDETVQDVYELLSAAQIRCLTTTIAVILAASLLVMFGLRSSPKDRVGITAAYAAVLVVFVGASTTNRGADNKYVAKAMGTFVGIVIAIVLILLGGLQYRWYQVRRALDSWEVISMDPRRRFDQDAI
jgi:hypothetical protein